MDASPATLATDPCLGPDREEFGRMAFASTLHKKIRGAKTYEKLDEAMAHARQGSLDDWDTAMAAITYKCRESDIHQKWLAQAFEDRSIGPMPDAWRQAWMRSKFLEHQLEHAPDTFVRIIEQWPEAIKWDIQRPDGRCSLLLKCGYAGNLALARALLEQFPEIVDKTIDTSDNGLGRLLFNPFLRQDDPSWLLLLHEFKPELLYYTDDSTPRSMIEMLAEYHRDKVLDGVLAVATEHDPMRRHGLALVHFAAKGVKSAKMDKKSATMRHLEPEEIMEFAHGFVRIARVLAKHGHDIHAKALKKHDSQGTRPRGYPLAGSSALTYFLKRNKAGSLPSEVLALLHSEIMRLTVQEAPAAAPPSRGARF